MSSPLHVVITDCSDKDFRNFAETSGLGAVKCTPEADGDLLCTLPPGKLETFYEQLRQEAAKAWEDPDSTTLNFDSAFFPSSEERMQPVRQLRGRVAALLARKKAALPAAYASPGYVYGSEAEPA